MIHRELEIDHTERLLKQFPVVAIIGPRQVGKTTLARQIAARRSAHTTHLDLEDPRDLRRLEDPMLSLEPLTDLVVIDEIQRRPDLFPALRVLADRPGSPARFLVLGSASPDLLHQSSESLAGRIAYHELPGFSPQEVGVSELPALWHRGRFPRSFLATSDAASAAWRREFVRTFLERDLAPEVGQIPATAMHRFWAMLAHYHAQTWNGAELARAQGVSQAAVRRRLDRLTDAFAVRQLQPYHANIRKRQVKSPKIYLNDTEILHTLLGIETPEELDRNPKVGASWEGFALALITEHLGARAEECFFWATQQGAELDLLVIRGERRRGFEIKRTDTPRTTRSMHHAMEALGLETLDVVHAGSDTFPLTQAIRAVALSRIQTDVLPLSGHDPDSPTDHHP